MLAYGQSKLEYQTVSVEIPIRNPDEEEKHPENENNNSPSQGRNSEQVN